MADCMQEWPEPVVRVQTLAESGLDTIPRCYVKPPCDRPVVQLATDVQEPSDVSIPVIDLGELLAEGGGGAAADEGHLDSLTEAVAAACREWGFFQVVNHGVRPELMRTAREAWRGFFRLPPPAKQQYANSPRTYEGYGSRLGVEKGAVLDWGDYYFLRLRPEAAKSPANPGICNPDNESTHNSKGNTSLRASVIDYYPGTQDPNGTGTGLAIACDNGGAYNVVNDYYTLNIKDCKLWQLGRDLAAIGNLKLLPKHIEDLSAAATTFTKERVEIGLPPSLAGFKLSALARVSEAANPGGATEVAANPGGATEVFLLDSGASFHAVGDDRILQGIWNFPFDMWATLPDNSPLRIIGIGTIEMNEFSIPNVFLVDRLRNNLISVSQLDIDHAMCSCFHGGQCTVMRRDGTVVGGAMLDGGMYQLRFLLV